MATQMLNHHVPLPAVAGRLAHACASTTLNVYAHTVPNGDLVTARAAARPVIEGFARNAHYAAMFAGAGLPIADDGTPSDKLIDAVTVHGDETGLTDRLGVLAEEQDELLVTLESAGDRRADQDTLLRALGNVTRSLATGHRRRTP